MCTKVLVFYLAACDVYCIAYVVHNVSICTSSSIYLYQSLYSFVPFKNAYSNTVLLCLQFFVTHIIHNRCYCHL